MITHFSHKPWEVHVIQKGWHLECIKELDCGMLILHEKSTPVTRTWCRIRVGNDKHRKFMYLYIAQTFTVHNVIERIITCTYCLQVLINLGSNHATDAWLEK